MYALSMQAMHPIRSGNFLVPGVNPDQIITYPMIYFVEIFKRSRRTVILSTVVVNFEGFPSAE